MAKKIYKIVVLAAELDDHYKHPVLSVHETVDLKEAAKIAHEAWRKDLGILFYVNGVIKQSSRYF